MRSRQRRLTGLQPRVTPASRAFTRNCYCRANRQLVLGLTFDLLLRVSFASPAPCDAIDRCRCLRVPLLLLVSLLSLSLSLSLPLSLSLFLFPRRREDNPKQKKGKKKAAPSESGSESESESGSGSERKKAKAKRASQGEKFKGWACGRCGSFLRGLYGAV